jgi:hypothetical protein
VTDQQFEQLREVSVSLAAVKRPTQAQYDRALGEARVIVGAETRYLETIQKYRPRDL